MRKFTLDISEYEKVTLVTLGGSAKVTKSDIRVRIAFLAVMSFVDSIAPKFQLPTIRIAHE